MSLHSEVTKQEVEGLLLHKLAVGKPSQLSDAFVLGMRFEQGLQTEYIKELEHFIESLQLSVGDDIKRDNILKEKK
jgi:predicted AAA+ superfamily ATPase